MPSLLDCSGCSDKQLLMKERLGKRNNYDEEKIFNNCLIAVSKYSGHTSGHGMGLCPPVFLTNNQ